MHCLVPEACRRSTTVMLLASPSACATADQPVMRGSLLVGRMSQQCDFMACLRFVCCCGIG